MSVSVRTPALAADAGFPGAGRLARLSRLCLRHARLVLAAHAMVAAVALVLGVGAFTTLSSGGYTATGTEAARAEQLLSDRFGASTADVTVYARATGSVDGPVAAASGRRLTAWARAQPGVKHVVSYWTSGRPELRSADGRAALIRLDLSGDEFTAMRVSERLAPGAKWHAGDLRTALTGSAVVNAETTRQSQRDLLRAELIVLPLTVLILLLAFRSLLASLVPTVIAVCAVTVSLAVVRLINGLMPMSVFSLNIAAALGFGLAVDYALFVVTRFREELDAGRGVEEAIVRSMSTAGRAAAYSGITVVAGLSVVLVLPLPFLRSLAVAGIVVVSAGAAVTVTALPALLALIGHRLPGGHGLWRRRESAGGRGAEKGRIWQAIARFTTAHPVHLLVLSTVFLLTLAVPFLHARFGVVDARVLPATAQARVISDRVAKTFAVDSERTVQVVLPDVNVEARSAQVDSYARSLSRIGGVTAVRAATGSYSSGTAWPETGRGSSPSGVHGTVISVLMSAPAQSEGAKDVVHRVRQVPAPGERLVTGRTAHAVDTATAVGDRLPWAIALAALFTMGTLLVCTRSVLVPVKAVLVGGLSLTASLGAMVWIFQEGHGRFLTGEFAVTGQLEMTMPVLVLALAFGASVDYELFLMTRIREEFSACGDHRQAIVTGIAHTGRLFTAAALIVAVAMAALATSGISMLKVLGTGLAIAVVVDATIVRGILVPAVLQLAGRANWWMPPLRRHPRLQAPSASRDRSVATHAPCSATPAESEPVP
ncbi:MMPL family transporter [Streptomyces sp. NPDC086554]|uniref:MMPL family transporter n=1 Tax=Streptomyces sp. NPDC086554 TaxID=3154864 RepID=UPI0034162FF7